MKITTYPFIENPENRAAVTGRVETAIRCVCEVLKFDPVLLETVTIADAKYLSQALKDVARSKTGHYTNSDEAVMVGKTLGLL